MHEVTRILKRVDAGEANATAELLEFVYDELRKLAAVRLKQESPGQTLQATALVHEAYLRLVNTDEPQIWDSRGHFFAAAAEAMRRILVDAARSKNTIKRGGQLMPHELVESQIAFPDQSADVLAVNEALEEFAAVDPRACEVVKLRCFVGMTLEEAADVLEISRRTAARLWSYARAWLQDRLKPS